MADEKRKIVTVKVPASPVTIPTDFVPDYIRVTTNDGISEWHVNMDAGTAVRRLCGSSMAAVTSHGVALVNDGQGGFQIGKTLARAGEDIHSEVVQWKRRSRDENKKISAADLVTITPADIPTEVTLSPGDEKTIRLHLKLSGTDTRWPSIRQRLKQAAKLAIATLRAWNREPDKADKAAELRRLETLAQDLQALLSPQTLNWMDRATGFASRWSESNLTALNVHLQVLALEAHEAANRYTGSGRPSPGKVIEPVAEEALNIFEELSAEVPTDDVLIEVVETILKSADSTRNISGRDACRAVASARRERRAKSDKT